MNAETIALVEPSPNIEPGRDVLTPDQEKAIQGLNKFFLELEEPLFHLKGYAGTGKTFLVKEWISRLIATRNIPSSNGFYGIGICAMTHDAVKVLKERLDFPLLFSGTLHSLLEMRPDNLTEKEKKEYYDLLLERDAGLDSLWGEEKVSYFKKLIAKLQDSVAGQLKFSKSAPASSSWGGALKLIIVDECSMVDSEMYHQICEFALREELKVLFIGDPEQVPPIGESMSLSFHTPCAGSLTQVVRYSGSIGKLASELRVDGCDYLNSFYEYLDDDDDSLVFMPESDVLEALAEKIQSGEIVDSSAFRIISTRNKSVADLNAKMRRLLGKDAYEIGDLLLAKGPVYRSKYQSWPTAKWLSEISKHCEENGLSLIPDKSTYPNVWAEDAKKGPYILNKEIVRVEWVHPVSVEYDDKTFTRYFLEVFPEGVPAVQNGVRGTGKLVSVIHPGQMEAWTETEETMKRLSSAFYTKSKKQRGQEGKAAEEVWVREGLRNWMEKLDGSPLKMEEFNSLSSKYYGLAKRAGNYCDPLQFTYASTVHCVQGKSLSISIVDLKSFKSTGRISPGWDLRRMFYTSVTRAKEQVIFSR